MTVPLSAEQQARLDRIGAAEPAPESIRRRVANAAHRAACDCGDADVAWSRYWQQIADAAIAVLRGPSVAEEAVRRCEELAGELTRTPDPGGAAVIAQRIRAALNGGER